MTAVRTYDCTFMHIFRSLRKDSVFQRTTAAGMTQRLSSRVPPLRRNIPVSWIKPKVSGSHAEIVRERNEGNQKTMGGRTILRRRIHGTGLTVTAGRAACACRRTGCTNS